MGEIVGDSVEIGHGTEYVESLRDIDGMIVLGSGGVLDGENVLVFVPVLDKVVVLVLVVLVVFDGVIAGDIDGTIAVGILFLQCHSGCELTAGDNDGAIALGDEMALGFDNRIVGDIGWVAVGDFDEVIAPRGE